LRAFARATGSNDCAALSGTGVDRDDAVSSSLMWSDRRRDGASSETLRRDKKPWGRIEGTEARGSALERNLDGSLAAIL
jgi:hypothetical protein